MFGRKSVKLAMYGGGYKVVANEGPSLAGRKEAEWKVKSRKSGQIVNWTGKEVSNEADERLRQDEARRRGKCGRSRCQGQGSYVV